MTLRKRTNNAVVTATLVLVTAVQCAAGYNILAIFPFSGKSHFQMFRAVADALVARGHDVTVVGHFPKIASTAWPKRGHDDRTGTYTDYSLAGSMPVFENFTVDELVTGYLDQFLLILQDGLDNCEAVLSSGRLDALIRTRAKFDLVLVEIFNTGCFVSLANQFGAPVVGITSTSLYPWFGGMVGDVVMPSYVPVNLLPFNTKMTFAERLINTAVLMLIRAYYKFKYEPEAQKMVDKYLGGLNGTVSEAVDNVNAIIVNTHFSFGDPRPVPQGIIEVGGCTYKIPKPLPEDLDRYVTSAERGVIYFSLGSIMKGSSVPTDLKTAMLRAFGRLEGYKVLWKWEDELPPQHDRPDNVMFLPWMPQFDILNHPNVKLFISHGGLMGILDALYSGVPVVGLPMFADQFSNINFIVQNRFGLQLPLDNIDERTVYDTLSAVLENDEFARNARHASKLYRDRDRDPLETAVFWIEYVARHRISLTPAAGQGWQELCLLDVAAAAVTALLIAVFMLRRLFSRVRLTVAATEAVR